MGSENVYLYIPNLIGYTRIVLLIISFFFMLSNPFIASSFYFLSAFLDAFDGVAARHYHQETKFGGVLDMLTDRCATTGLLVALAVFYPFWAFFFQLFIAIDISSHWIHVQCAFMSGSTSHKKIDLGANPILKHYYSNRTILFLMCAGNEAFYWFLYVYHFTYGPIINAGLFSFSMVGLICVITFPVAVVKMAINVIQLLAACHNIVEIDRAEIKKKVHAN